MEDCMHTCPVSLHINKYNLSHFVPPEITRLPGLSSGEHGRQRQTEGGTKRADLRSWPQLRLLSPGYERVHLAGNLRQVRVLQLHRRISWGDRGGTSLWNFHQPVKEVKSAGKIFKRCPYDFASEVRYTVNVRKFDQVKKNVPPLGLCLRYAYDHHHHIWSFWFYLKYHSFYTCPLVKKRSF